MNDADKNSAAKIRPGSTAFWRANIALFLSAFSIFALLYSVQPLLPIFAQEFSISPAASSLSLSLSTATLAVAMVLASWVADRVGRKALMVGALSCATVLGLLVVISPDWWVLLVVRALLGVALSGVPAVAMAYLAEEMDAQAFGFSMGLYIGGNAIGGMAGRLLVGLITDYSSWRIALAVLGGVVMVNALLFWWLLPQPAHSVIRRLTMRQFLAALLRPLQDAGLPWLFAVSFLLMGSFVTLYNYAGFRLLAPPFLLSHTAISLVFLLYLIGTGSSTWLGALSARFGRRKLLWAMIAMMAAGLALTGLNQLMMVITGIAIVTFGFFGAHSVASAWVARRAGQDRAQASSLYLFSYYLGSSVIGTAGGMAWQGGSWNGVMMISGGAMALALMVAIRLFF